MVLTRLKRQIKIGTEERGAEFGMACGLAAALSLDRRCLDTAIRSGRLDARSHGRRFRQGLTVAQVALALLLVIAAGLLVRTVRALGALELGFDPHNVISVSASRTAARSATSAG